MRTFEDVDAWKSANELRNWISLIVKEFPTHERFELISQLKRSSRQVGNYIAQGYGKLLYQENINACKQARGSLFETLDHMLNAHDEGCVNDLVMHNFREQWAECVRLLNAYIAYIRRARNARAEGYEQNESSDYHEHTAHLHLNTSEFEQE
jgi:four helix bundle protein